MKSVESKREREKRVVSLMILLYCRKNHKNRAESKLSWDENKNAKGYKLCTECASLQEYAMLRSDKCPFMETKSFCSNCKVHCYKPQMREQIRAVMRFSGPRMMLYHPIMAIRHVIESRKEKGKLDKEQK